MPRRCFLVACQYGGNGAASACFCLSGMPGPQAACDFYIHGAGWVFGSFHTHEKLVRELAARTGCVVVFPEYSRAPEALSGRH